MTRRWIRRWRLMIARWFGTILLIDRTKKNEFFNLKCGTESSADEFLRCVTVSVTVEQHCVISITVGTNTVTPKTQGTEHNGSWRNKSDKQNGIWPQFNPTQFVDGERQTSRRAVACEPEKDGTRRVAVDACQERKEEKEERSNPCQKGAGAWHRPKLGAFKRKGCCLRLYETNTNLVECVLSLKHENMLSVAWIPLGIALENDESSGSDQDWDWKPTPQLFCQLSLRDLSRKRPTQQGWNHVGHNNPSSLISFCLAWFSSSMLTSFGPCTIILATVSTEVTPAGSFMLLMPKSSSNDVSDNSVVWCTLVLCDRICALIHWFTVCSKEKWVIVIACADSKNRSWMQHTSTPNNSDDEDQELVPQLKAVLIRALAVEFENWRHHQDIIKTMLRCCWHVVKTLQIHKNMREIEQNWVNFRFCLSVKKRTKRIKLDNLVAIFERKNCVIS